MAAAATGALALPASALAGGITVVGHFPNHTPVVNKPWKVTVDVTKGKTKLSGTVYYEFLLGSVVVGTKKDTGGTYRFKNGVWKNTMTFPPDAVGNQLTLAIFVSTKDGSKELKWTVDPKQ
ncbi:MAG TPA: hypothetical protein VME01_01925 [Solirubrobacteraceae bacterium]|nr:hypothetical protein [Solirubrobacteraceae bacterium]